MGIEVAWDHAQTFSAANFGGAERHRRRLSKVAQPEERSSEFASASAASATWPPVWEDIHAGGTLFDPRDDQPV
jgi:hypothetical protein